VQRQGRTADGEAMASEALQRAEALGDREIEAEALYVLGILQFDRGALADAARSQERARLQFEEVGRAADATLCMYERAILERRLGAPDRALATTREVLERAAVEGGRAVQANAYTSLGEIAREIGDLEAAERHYDRALALCEAIGTPNVMVGRLNVALVRMARGRWDEARTLLERTRDELAEAGWKGLLLCAHVELMACDAALSDFAAWDREAEAARPLLAEWDATDPDLAWAATRAAELATRAGERQRARTAWEIALREWRALGNPEEEERAARALEGPTDG